MTQLEFATAYKDGFRRTLRYILSKGLSPDEAEEIAQTAWTRGWEHRAELHDFNAVHAWINTIALNVLRNFARRRKREVSLDGQPLPAPYTTRSADRVDLQRMLSGCNPMDRTLFRLRHLEGHSASEAARRCGISAVTARVRMMRARRRILKSYDSPWASGWCGAGPAAGTRKCPKRTNGDGA